MSFASLDAMTRHFIGCPGDGGGTMWCYNNACIAKLDETVLGSVTEWLAPNLNLVTTEGACGGSISLEGFLGEAGSSMAPLRTLASGWQATPAIGEHVTSSPIVISS